MDSPNRGRLEQCGGFAGGAGLSHAVASAGGLRLLRLFVLGFLLVALAVLHCRFKITDAFAQTLADGGKLARSEEQEQDRDNQQQMQRLKKTFTHNSSTGRVAAGAAQASRRPLQKF